MATKNIVPRATGEGGIGTTLKHWASAFIDTITAKKVIADNFEGALKGDITADNVTNTDGNKYTRIIRGSTEPTDTSVLWLDTTTSPYVLKWYDTTNKAWVSYVSGADNANYVQNTPMPSIKYDNLNLTSSTTLEYTALTDGYIVLGYTSSTQSRAYITIDGGGIGAGNCTYGVEQCDNFVRAAILTCPIAKGRTAYINTSGTINYCRFVYAIKNS